MICCTCRVDKDLEHFYKYKTKEGPRPYSKCKTCVIPVKDKKPVGFAKLDIEIQSQVLKMLADRRIKLSAIAEHVKVPYATFATWVRNGQCAITI